MASRAASRHRAPSGCDRGTGWNRPWTPVVRRESHHPCPARPIPLPREGSARQMGTAAFHPPPPPPPPPTARAPESHPRRPWPRAREGADTFFQAQDPHGVQGVNQRQAQAKPLAEGPGHRFQLVVAPGKLAVPGPRVAEGVDHGPLALVRGGWREDSRSPGPVPVRVQTGPLGSPTRNGVGEQQGTPPKDGPSRLDAAARAARPLGPARDSVVSRVPPPGARGPHAEPPTAAPCPSASGASGVLAAADLDRSASSPGCPVAPHRPRAFSRTT